MADNVDNQILGTLRAGGLSAAGAAGVAGNWDQESGDNPASAGGYLGQWIGPRAAALANYARSQGQPITSPVVQSKFALTELRQQYPGLYHMLQTTNNPGAAALAVSNQYERPLASAANNPHRIAGAQQDYAAMRGGKVPVPGTRFTTGSLGSSRTINTPSHTDEIQAGIDAFLAAANKPINTSGKVTVSNPLAGYVNNIASGKYTTPGSSKTITTPGSPGTRVTFPDMTGKTLRSSGLAAGFLPKGAPWTRGRQDQGRDGNTTPGGPIIANGSGVVLRVASDPGGFGPSYPVVHFTSGPYAGKDMYFGHTLSALHAGQRFGAGQVISHTGYGHGVGNATVPGWVEIGFAPGGNPGPMGQPAPF